MERQAVPHHTIDFLLWCSPRLRPPILAPTLSHSVALSDTLQKQSSLISALKPLSHLFHNPSFQPRMNIQAFRWWLNKGLFRIGHFLTSSGPITLGTCLSKLEMPDTEIFRLSQIRHFLHALWTDKSPFPNPTAYEQWCSNLTDQRGGISLIYTSLAQNVNLPTYARAWESDLDLHLDPEDWFHSFRRSYKGILNTGLIEANVKLITRWYYVPTRLAKIYPDALPLCFRGCGHLGTIHHIWWTCPRIRSFWNHFIALVRKVTGTAISQDPKIALLNHWCSQAYSNREELPCELTELRVLIHCYIGMGGVYEDIQLTRLEPSGSQNDPKGVTHPTR